MRHKCRFPMSKSKDFRRVASHNSSVCHSFLFLLLPRRCRIRSIARRPRPISLLLLAKIANEGIPISDGFDMLLSRKQSLVTGIDWITAQDNRLDFEYFHSSRSVRDCRCAISRHDQRSLAGKTDQRRSWILDAHSAAPCRRTGFAPQDSSRPENRTRSLHHRR